MTIEEAAILTGEVLSSPQPLGPPPKKGWRLLATQLSFLIAPFGTVSRRFKRYGDAYRVEQSSGWLYVLRHPDHIRDVLVTHAASFDKQHSAFQQLSLVLGDALLTSDGERWRRQRRMVQPAFARSRLQQYSEVMVEAAAEACRRLERGGRVDLSRELNALTLTIVTRTLFGQNLDDGGRTNGAMLELNRWFGLPPMIIRLIPGAQARFERATATLDDVIDRLITTKRASLSQDGANGEAAGADLLSVLMQARDEQDEPLTPRELRDQLLTLYVAGHETTSHALTWTFFLLARNPDVLAKLREELTRVLGARLPTFDDLSALPYTEQVLKEALRLYPPAFLIPRRAHEDVDVGPYRVPRGSEVICWIYLTQRDPRWYPEPEKFRPERFEPAQEAARPKSAYLPFGAGQRACIGQMFAMIEAQLILATLVPRLSFKYLRRRDPTARTGVTLAPRGGMPMRVRARS